MKHLMKRLKVGEKTVSMSCELAASSEQIAFEFLPENGPDNTKINQKYFVNSFNFGNWIRDHNLNTLHVFLS